VIADITILRNSEEQFRPQEMEHRRLLKLEVACLCAIFTTNDHLYQQQKNDQVGAAPPHKITL